MSDIVKNNNMPDIGSCPLGLEVSPRVEIKHIRQIKGTFEQKLKASPSPKSVSIDNSAKVDIDDENLHVFVFADFNLNARLEKEEEPVVSIKASFLLVYEITHLDDLTDEHFKQFAETNGVFNAWPYWREYVQSVSVRMGLPALTVPVFCLYKPKKSETDATTESTPKN